MKDSASDPTADIAREYLERENKEKQVLALLLEKFLGRKDQILVQKTEMGGTEAYVCRSGSLRLWLTSVSEKVQS
jgi:hypothetical protein